MLLFDTTDMDVDEELNDIVESESFTSYPYIIMSKDTFRLFKKLSTDYDKKSNCWWYSGPEAGYPDKFQIAIDKSIPFGEVKVK
nr:MAG TPA: hypothetical protein [Caudoviricetes sp.]